MHELEHIEGVNLLSQLLREKGIENVMDQIICDLREEDDMA